MKFDLGERLDRFAGRREPGDAEEIVGLRQRGAGEPCGGVEFVEQRRGPLRDRVLIARDRGDERRAGVGGGLLRGGVQFAERARTARASATASRRTSSAFALS